MNRFTSPNFYRRTTALGIVVALSGGCGGEQREGGRPPIVALEPGLEIVRRWPPEGEGDRQIPVTLVHVDPSRFELRLLTAAEHGGSRPADHWAHDFGLVAVINASMYLPNDRSTGLMVDGEHANNPQVNPRFGGLLAFGPVRDDLPPFRLVGLECPGVDLDELRASYRTLVQNYRLLDCVGEPIPWDDRKLYATAAIGVDDRGWLVLIHSGSPQQTGSLARWLARKDWGVVAAHFVEGGYDASLYVDAAKETLAVIGSYEGAVPARDFRDVPNVLGIVRRTETP